MGDIGNICLMSIDGTHFPIQEPGPFDKKWYSFKHNCSGLTYEIGVSIKLGEIVWFNGPFPGSTNDLTIFRNSLKKKLSPGEKVIADNGYRDYKARLKGEESKQEDYDWRKAHREIRARQEIINRRIKQYRCMSEIFRHGEGKHAKMFQAVIVITQMNIWKNGTPFHVNYVDPLDEDYYGL